MSHDDRVKSLCINSLRISKWNIVSFEQKSSVWETETEGSAASASAPNVQSFMSRTVQWHRSMTGRSLIIVLQVTKHRSPISQWSDRFLTGPKQTQREQFGWRAVENMTLQKEQQVIVCGVCVTPGLQKFSSHFTKGFGICHMWDTKHNLYVHIFTVFLFPSSVKSSHALGSKNKDTKSYPATHDALTLHLKEQNSRL